ncbi:toll-like receptor 5 [Centroberyx gerrardi]|uniref:toll-like receptor 5 n=1 Tax=Centroberyx gerrardi TaxID=166262 RepID=UPI003AB0C5C8
MWTLALQLVVIGVYLQVPRCYPSCRLYGSIANCAYQHHLWVPALPPFITHLYLENNNISEINDTSLSGLEELQELDLGMQNVKLTIRNNAFLRQKKLTRFVLGYNIGLQLEPKAFVGLSNLRSLYLDYCQLGESILKESYLQPLSSLESLDLFGNHIERLRPARFFSNLIKFTELNLTLNRIEMICEEDLVGFRGKYFQLLNLDSNRLNAMGSAGFDWGRCGNPFRGMAFNKLDLSSTGLNLNNLAQFLKAIEGTQIGQLKLSGHIGKGFSHDNFPDPDDSTFEGLKNSAISTLDLSKNWIFALQRSVFSPLKDAIIIDISHNKVNQINRNAFDGLQGHLRLLNLSFNLLGEIYSHTFANLTDLRVLDLSYNHIGALGYESFSGFPNLRALYLTGNSLRDLGFPASLPNLQYLLLDDNKLDAASQRSVIKLGNNIIHLNIENNRLNNLEDVYVIVTQFKRLKNLFYGGNFIKWCTINPNVSVPRPNSLEVLDLHDSSLQTIWAQGKCLDLFDRLENLIGVNLSLNSLATLPKGIFSGLTSVLEMDLSSNSLTYLQPDVFPISLKRLLLSDNFLASPDPATFRSLSFINLAMNRFHCDCNLESFLTWLNETNATLQSPEEYRCEFPSDLYSVPLLDYYRIVEPCEDEESAAEDLRFALFVCSALLLLLVIVNAIVYTRFRGRMFIIYKKIVGRVLEGPQTPPPAGDVQYDAYLCFSDSDYRWVEAALLKKLDCQFSPENILRCCFEARDFLPGEDHLSNIRDAVWASRKTVCIVSNEFLKDGWCLEAFTLAQGRMLEELTNVLIMLVVEKVPHYQLMKYNAVRAFVQRREYLVWPEDPQDLAWFYERLVSQILKNTKVKKPTEDKPEPDIQPENGDGIQLEQVRPVEM